MDDQRIAALREAAESMKGKSGRVGVDIADLEWLLDTIDEQQKALHEARADLQFAIREQRQAAS